MTSSYDVLVIGGGIAGVSIAYELSSDRSVGLIEMESTLAYHTTGHQALGRMALELFLPSRAPA